MGGETSPHDLYLGVVQAAQHLGPAYTFAVFATPEVAQGLAPHHQIRFHSAPETITMGDPPLEAIRHKKKSSLITGIKFLKRKGIHAFVSTGNTGALIAASSLILHRQQGVRKAALLAELPTLGGITAVLDVGGNVQCKAEDLLQFARLGTEYMRTMHKILEPRIGLLNIGVESKKGTSEHQRAYQLLQGEHFVGNVEGKEIFQGKVDILVTDGFTGNVLLKSVEGVSAFILKNLSQNGTAAPELKKKFDPEEYSGALVVGVKGIVVKCHGSSSPRALFKGILAASRFI